MKSKSSNLKAALTRQARSIARIRAARRAQKLCCECGAPTAIRKIVSTGKTKILSRCAACLSAHAAREADRK